MSTAVMEFVLPPGNPTLQAAEKKPQSHRVRREEKLKNDGIISYQKTANFVIIDLCRFNRGKLP